MRVLKVKLSIGYPGAVQRDEIEVKDDATEDEIEQIAREWAFEHIDWSWVEERGED